MFRTRRLSTSALALLALGLAGTVAVAADAPAPMAPEAMAWGDAPPVLPAGAKITVLSGNPMAEGPFVLRLKFPGGYEVPAHFHSGDELITVVSGTFGVGHGDKLDRAMGTVLPAGGFVEMPAGHHHYAWAETDTVVQIHGPGPFDMTYIDPADDPLTQ
ncbi:MAG: cupin domain-containing protein [Bauldia sp.]|uniref:cupin domain-containing protein n=1 Tax=Bauldia sp. TaxID=2575872 RepID=UPI001D793A09|nr:cupin domain-containing protein [Bauldia sp.]MCB1498051.1 cupin domain-containing protein [Bauldia sp.]